MHSQAISRARFIATIGLSLLGFIAAPRIARAVDCEWIAQTLVPSDGEVPASLPSIVWTASPNTAQSQDPSSIVSFSRIDDKGASTPVPFRFEPVDFDGTKATKIVPNNPLEAGLHYRIVANPLNGENLDATKDFDTSEFKTSAALAIPRSTKLGILRLTSALKRERLSIIDGGGAVEFPAVIQEISLELSPELTAWGPALIYETLVDGVPWNEPEPICSTRLGESWVGRGVDRVFASCGTPEQNKFVRSGVTRGKHTLQFRARLVGSTQVYLSNQMSVNFECQPDTSTGTDTTSTTGDSSGTSTGSETGSSPGTDSTQTSGTGSAGSSSGRSDTCSVSNASGRDLAWTMGMLALFGLTAPRRNSRSK